MCYYYKNVLYLICSHYCSSCLTLVKNEIYQSLVVQLDNNIVNRRSLCLLFSFCASKVEIHQVGKPGGKKINKMVSSYPIFWPTLTDFFYQTDSVEKGEHKKVENWVYVSSSTLKQKKCVFQIFSAPKPIKSYMPCAVPNITSTLILHNNPNGIRRHERHSHFTDDVAEAYRSRNLPKNAQLSSGIEPRVLTLKSILFTLTVLITTG